MKLVLAMSLICSSLVAQAAIELGHYSGYDYDLQECQIEIQEINYRGGIKSPFNEIVTAVASVSELAFDLRHRFKVQGTRISMPNKDLVDVQTSKNGHESLTVNHVHVDGQGRVSSFVYVLHNPKAGVARKVVCNDMKLITD